MVDNDIIKAFECCLKAKTKADCEDANCPAYYQGNCIFAVRTDDDFEGLIFAEMCKDLVSVINRQRAEIEALNAYAKTTSELAFRARQDMTSITRFVRLEKDSPNYDKYKELAERAVENILKSLNDNPDLAEIEKYIHKHSVKEKTYG